MRSALMLAILLASPLEAQRTHLLLVTGLGGEPAYDQAFLTQGAAIFDAARTDWGVSDSSRIWLAPDPSRDPSRIRARASREGVRDAFLALSHRVGAGDVVVVLLIGHGSGEGSASRVNLPGADPTAAEYGNWLGGFAKQSVLFVVAASGSGDFVAALRGAGRVVVTATRTAFERNESLFGEAFVRGLTTRSADVDKDGRVSALESFTFANAEVVRAYAEKKRLRTEHAVLSDSVLAGRIVLGRASIAVDDPRVATLVAERKGLEDQVAALRARKDGMEPAAYERELERLLVAVAELTRRIRDAGGRP